MELLRAVRRERGTIVFLNMLDFLLTTTPFRTLLELLGRLRINKRGTNGFNFEHFQKEISLHVNNLKL